MVKKGKGRGRPSKRVVAGNDDNGSTRRHQQSPNPIPSSPATPLLDHIFSQTRRYFTRSLLAQSEAIRNVKVRVSAADFSRSPTIVVSSDDLPHTSSDSEEIGMSAADYLDPHQGSIPVIAPPPVPPPAAAHEVAPEFSMCPRDVNGNQAEGSCVNSNEQRRSLARSSSPDYTMITEMIETTVDEVDSAVYPTLVTVGGYRVKEEVAPLLRSIFQKYGDIAKDCSVESIRARLLERVCAIYLDLEKRKPTDVSTFLIEYNLAVVAGLQATKVEVGWLWKRLEDILEAVREARRYTALKDQKARKILKAEILAKELEEPTKRTQPLESEMAAIQAEVKESDEALVNSKRKMNLLKCSLVVNLL